MIEALVLASPREARAARPSASPTKRSRPGSRAIAVTVEPAARDRRAIVPDDAAGIARRPIDGACAPGGVVALPTDTVYGIARRPGRRRGGIERLFEVKRRPPDKGIMLLLADAAQAADDRRR